MAEFLESRCLASASENSCLPLELGMFCVGCRERLDTPEIKPMSPTSSVSTAFPSRRSGVGTSGVDSFSSGCSSSPISESVFDDDVTESVLCIGCRERLDTPECWTMSPTSSISTTWPMSPTSSVSATFPSRCCDQKQEEGKPKASKKESPRARQRRAKRLAQLDLSRSRERFYTPFWPEDDIESMVFPTSGRGSEDASLSCSLSVSRKSKRGGGRARQRKANAMRKHACDL